MQDNAECCTVVHVMKITVWGVNYAPELTGIAPFNTTLCEHLAIRSHDVTMVTAFPYYPEWKKRAGDVNSCFRSENANGVTVHRCWLYVPRKLSALRRIAHEGSFVITSLFRILTLERPDLYIIVSPPLLLGVAAWIAGRIKHAPHVFHVQDLQPDAAIGLGMLHFGMLTKILYWIESFSYSKAARVSGISRGMLEMFQKKGVPKEKVVYFPNGVKLSNVAVASGAFRSRLGIPEERFVALYSGNLGVKQGLDILIEAADLLESNNIPGKVSGNSSRSVLIVISGDGSRKDALADSIRMRKLRNVILLPLQSDQAYREMLADADCAVITQQQGTGSFFFPSKLLTSLSAGKPVLTVADESSELASACRDGGFGINVLPNQPAELASALCALAKLRTEAAYPAHHEI